MDWEMLFCDVDDFCREFEPLWQGRQLENGGRKRRRSTQLAASEIMTILIAFQPSQIRTFKHYYRMLSERYRPEFPRLVGYSRFVELMPRVLPHLTVYLHSRFGPVTGMAFVDSTSLAVCHPKRI